MYIYDLPFPINKELCRLLDNDDDWKELAGVYMKYSAFDVNEIEQKANREKISPTSQLFTQWGQLNHKVEELFILLYRMKHIPALKCLVPVVDSRFQKLLQKHDSKNVKKETENGDVKAKTQKENGSESSLPLPVMLIEKGIQSPMPHPAKVLLPSKDSTTNTSKDTSSAQSPCQKGVEDELVKSVSSIPMLRYEDILVITNNWSKENLLGRGGFGQVYKGEWIILPVAVKRLSNKDTNNKELIREMCPNQYRHDNILPLYAYSIGGPEACLVYQLMEGGSLEQRLKCKTHHPPLSWSQRYWVALGVTRGLQHLHIMTGTPLIHGDIKPANILLDVHNNPKIADFGLARKGPHGEDRTHLKVSSVNGTRPYLPDEYLRSRQLSPAVDVFSFGVVLLELASALPALDRVQARAPDLCLLRDYLHHLAPTGLDFATLEDPILRGTINSNPQLCREFIAIGLRCTHSERKKRPTMLEVYKTLKTIPERIKLN